MRNFSHRKWRPYKPPLEELIATMAPNKCWIWLGSVHKRWNTPIYKGKEHAWRVVYEKFKGPLLEGDRSGGTTCGSRLCVNPEHRILR